MSGRHLRYRAFVFVAASVLIMGGALSPVRAACYPQAQQLPAATLAQFKANPAQMLTQFPDGGAQMISMIRDLVASDPTTLPLILDLAKTANADQMNAIGTGLGDGALICIKTDQAFANEIQQMVAALGNQTIALAFTGVLGDQGIAAVGGAGGGAGGGGEEGTGTTGGGGFGGGTNNFSLTTSVTNNGNYFTSSFASGSSPGTTTTTTSVSPSRP